MDLEGGDCVHGFCVVRRAYARPSRSLFFFFFFFFLPCFSSRQQAAIYRMGIGTRTPMDVEKRSRRDARATKSQLHLAMGIRFEGIGECDVMGAKRCGRLTWLVRTETISSLPNERVRHRAPAAVWALLYFKTGGPRGDIICIGFRWLALERFVSSSHGSPKCGILPVREQMMLRDGG
jgi:hypothetical protein